MEKQKVINLKAAARALGVLPASLKAEADAGKVPHTRVGDDYLFSLPALEAALEARAAGERGGEGTVAHAR